MNSILLQQTRFAQDTLHRTRDIVVAESAKGGINGDAQTLLENCRSMRMEIQAIERAITPEDDAEASEFGKLLAFLHEAPFRTFSLSNIIEAARELDVLSTHSGDAEASGPALIAFGKLCNRYVDSPMANGLCLKRHRKPTCVQYSVVDTKPDAETAKEGGAS